MKVQKKSISALYGVCIILLVAVLWQAPPGNAADSAFSGTDVYFFGSAGCPECMQELRMIERIVSGEWAQTARVHFYDIDQPDNFLLLLRYEQAYGIHTSESLSVFLGASALSGKELIRSRFRAVLSATVRQGIGTKHPSEVMANPAPDNNALSGPTVFRPSRPVIAAAGLVDGLNPCAFATIVFLVTLMSVLRRSRRALLAVGMSFGGGVFVAYLLLGWGAVAVVRSLMIHSGVKFLIHRGVSVIAFVLALVSARDAVLFSRTRNTGNVWLKLPGVLRIQATRLSSRAVRSRVMLPAVFGAGVVVALLESVCTGQIYLPTILYMVRSGQADQHTVFDLLLYNIMFIVPLLAVFLLSAAGMRSARVQSFFQRHVVLSKLLLAGIFGLLAIVLW